MTDDHVGQPLSSDVAGHRHGWPIRHPQPEERQRRPETLVVTGLRRAGTETFPAAHEGGLWPHRWARRHTDCGRLGLRRCRGHRDRPVQTTPQRGTHRQSSRIQHRAEQKTAAPSNTPSRTSRNVEYSARKVAGTVHPYKNIKACPKLSSNPSFSRLVNNFPDCLLPPLGALPEDIHIIVSRELHIYADVVRTLAEFCGRALTTIADNRVCPSRNFEHGCSARSSPNSAGKALSMRG